MIDVQAALPLAPTPPAADPAGQDDGELLELVHTLPAGSRRRSAACRGSGPPLPFAGPLVCAPLPGQPGAGRRADAGRLVGLIKAINNFDPAFGGGLAAYAQPCISGEIKRHFRDKRWQVHLRRSLQEQVLEVRKTRDSLRQELGTRPRPEIASRRQA